ncbi:MAG: hypothetical protein QNJ72_35845 [Pleurocapsa sp. MO_226.B13]|nr:hypothetical protein [Pleurocapsa sp. MO_226.B13]
MELSKQLKNKQILSWSNAIANLSNQKADCYRRVFARIEPNALQRCFQRWVTEIVKDTGGQVIPIDGKTLGSSDDRN